MDLLNRLLYRDGLMLIIDKPAGIAVHPGPGGGPHLQEMLDMLRFGLPKPPALAHRLDRLTSGCLVLGRHRKALARLGNLFATGKVKKSYWALVMGTPPHSKGRVDLPIRQVAKGNRQTARIDPGGKPAVTEYRLLGRNNGMGWLLLSPQTGRMHQLRVHCAALGCPVLGDPLYGVKGQDQYGGGLFLHARSVEIPLYPRKPPIAVAAPPPPAMSTLLKTFEAQAAGT